MRRTVTVSLVVLGLLLMVIGFLTAAPWGSNSVADSNPTIIGAPILFLLGEAAVVAAAVLYEILPDRRR